MIFRTFKYIFGLGLCLSLATFTQSIDLILDLFQLKNFTVSNNNSLILQMTTGNKFLCLQKCSINSYCLYAQYETYNCNLYAQNAKNNLISSIDKKVYEKKNFIFQEEQSDNSNQNVSYGTCSNSSEFWSLKTNSCEPCKPEFVKYSEVPFLCYHHTGGQTFPQSKSYCITKGGVLFMPKTKHERDFFGKIFPGKKAYVNSMITKRGEKFKWPDGTNVFGFDWNQPNNFGWPWSLNENCLMINWNGFLHDVPDNRIFDLTICQHP
ncbi:unnamed protein product [Brachionus calyciflorus]|uniref:C-type lectin domain-containing protein n=1 Tax=Brachionus calyciflorus TaxID=104777 RepID=A0A814PJE8_9BILA|nr:unnamed protein product [Brachionus calyciflorus]